MKTVVPFHHHKSMLKGIDITNTHALHLSNVMIISAQQDNMSELFVVCFCGSSMYNEIDDSTNQLWYLTRFCLDGLG